MGATGGVSCGCDWGCELLCALPACAALRTTPGWTGPGHENPAQACTTAEDAHAPSAACSVSSSAAPCIHSGQDRKGVGVFFKRAQRGQVLCVHVKGLRHNASGACGGASRTCASTPTCVRPCCCIDLGQALVLLIPVREERAGDGSQAGRPSQRRHAVVGDEVRHGEGLPGLCPAA